MAETEDTPPGPPSQPRTVADILRDMRAARTAFQSGDLAEADYVERILRLDRSFAPHGAGELPDDARHDGAERGDGRHDPHGDDPHGNDPHDRYGDDPHGDDPRGDDPHDDDDAEALMVVEAIASPGGIASLGGE